MVISAWGKMTASREMWPMLTGAYQAWVSSIFHMSQTTINAPKMIPPRTPARLKNPGEENPIRAAELPEVVL
jgi:hypothetical protein